ncbi:MAG: hypothetical protein ABIS84_13045 [Arachnia sp.]
MATLRDWFGDGSVLVLDVPATTSLADLVHQREALRPHGPT